MPHFRSLISTLFQTRALLAALLFALVDVAPAAALSVSQIDAPTLLRDRSCTAGDRTRFRVRFVVTGDTRDSGRNDLYSLYLVDGTGLILHRRGQRQREGRTNTRNRWLETRVDPTAGPFRIVIVDRTSGGPQGQGQILSRPALASVRFDAAALDSDCPGVPAPSPAAAPADVAADGATDAAGDPVVDPDIALRASVATQTVELGRAGLLQPAALTLGRLRRLSAGGVDGAGVAPSAGLFGLSTGAAGQAAPDGWGLWADATWSRLQPEASGGGTIEAVSVAAGVDRELGDHVVAGVAVFGTVAESEAGGVESDERSAGFSPYVSVALGEGVGLHASAGYGYAWGETTRDGGEGDYDAHRGYATLEASYSREIGDVSLETAVGALFGRSARGAYVDSGGLAIDADQTDVGAAHVVIQPGYNIDLGDGLTTTPYLHAEYRRAFATGENVTPDSARLGLGARLEGATGVSANFEALRGVGAGGDKETSLQLHIAFDF